MQKPLDGLRVVDLSQWLAGPAVAMVLSGLGADVVRVDPPGGPFWRHPSNAMLQRGKRSVALNLKDEADLVIARRLIRTADIVVESFRPGVASRLGVGPQESLASNPRLIYCSIPGFGHDDPRAGVPGWESVIAAETSLLPPREDSQEHERRFTSLPTASSYAMTQATHGILAALIARERTGVGQWVETPLFDAAFELLGGGVQKIGDDIPPAGGAAAPAAMPQVGNYRGSDGKWLQLCLIQPRHLDWFMREYFPERIDEGWNDPTRIADDPELQAAIRSALTNKLGTRPAREWERDINERTGAPTGLAQTTEDWLLADEHARDAGSVIELDDFELGRTAQAGFAFELSATPPAVAGGRRPLDSDRAAILSDLAEWEREPRTLPPAEAPQLDAALSGIRIVDVSQVLAGPTVGRVLVEYGATAIKINSFEDRQHFMHTYTNSGKESLLVNLKTPGGKELMETFLKDTDVFVENFTQGVAERLGIGDADLRRIRPDIIRANVSAFGHHGYRGTYRGREELGQAVTGIQTRWFGQDSPRMVFWPLNDFGSGNWAAVGVLAALYHRMRTGQGQMVSSSLSHNATFLQLPFMVAYEGRVWDEPSGEDEPGYGPFDRIYRASDRWFVVVAGSREQEDAVLAVAGVARDADVELNLEAAFAAQPAEAWVEALVEAGIGAAVARTQEEVMEDPLTKARGLSLERTLPSGTPIRTVGPSKRLSATPVRVGRLASPPGTDLDCVLERIGWRDRKSELLASGAVLEQLPDDADYVGRFKTMKSVPRS